MNAIDILKKRSLIAQSTPDIEKWLSKPRKFYLGFEPSSDSLHIGNLLPIVLAKQLISQGHTPYILIGGATARIGDPSGRDQERTFMELDLIQKNSIAIKKNIEELLQKENFKIINNLDWFEKITWLDFLRDAGKEFRLSYMLAKDSVKSRLQGSGISFTEFCYQIMQGYDFLHLFDEHNVTVQIGGSDQWGNLTAGIELIRKKRAHAVHALTCPLLLKADGSKFGKSVNGAIWISKDRLSAYDFYQQLIQVDDADVFTLLRQLTTLELEYIDSLEHKKDSNEPNFAQKILAKELTSLVHGVDALKKALVITEHARPGKDTQLTSAAIKTMMEELPTFNMSSKSILNKKFVELLVHIQLVSSKSEAIRLIKNRGAYINNEKVSDKDYTIQLKDIIENRYLVCSAGKKRKAIICIDV